jgi:hypothetical protein
MAAWTPAEIATALWLDAADADTITLDGSDNVEQWDDKSGNGRHLAQSGSTLRPTVSGSSVVFDGENDYLSINHSFFSGITSYSIFCAGQNTDSGANIRWMFRERVAGGNPNLGFMKLSNTQRFYRRGYSATDPVDIVKSAAWPTTACIVGMVTSSANGEAFINGASDGTSSDTIDSFTFRSRFYLGTGMNADGTPTLNAWQGGISEFIIIQENVSTVTRQKIEGYLAHKWGLEGSLPADHPYKTFAPGKDIEVSTEVTNVTLSVERSLSISDVEIISEVEQSKTWADAADIEAISVESSSEVGAATLTRVVTLNLTNIEVSSEVNSLTLTRIACLAHADIECATEVSSIYLQRIEIIPPLWCSITPGSPYTLIAHADPSIGVTPGSPRIVAKLKE